MVHKGFYCPDPFLSIAIVILLIARVFGLFQEPLPPFPLVGMLNKNGGKVRLTFKLELDQVWIGTKERTDKIPMNTIKSIVSEPIEGHEQYHVMVNYLSL